MNILLRTAHLGAMGVLLGGHAFDVARDRLMWGLWSTIGTGIALAVLEAGPRLLWFHQLRGVMTLGKLVLIAAVPFAWEYRLPILLAVVAIASVGAHMPGRFRYYSVIFGKVIPYGSGPGTSQLGAGRVYGEQPPASPVVGEKCRQCDMPATFHITEIAEEDCREIRLCLRHAREYLPGPPKR